MVDEATIIDTNRWAYTLPTETPYQYQSWLSEIFLYGLWWLGNVPLLTLTRTVVVTASYGLVAWLAWRTTRQGKAVALALLLAALIGWNNWTLRPQTLALLPGAAFIVVLGGYRAGLMSARWLLLLPLVMMLWVNGHGSFLLGVGLVGLAWVGTIMTAVRGTPNTATRARQQIGPLTLASGATLLATFVNPQGPGIFPYVHMMITQRSLLQWFVEWFPPQNTLGLANTGFWFFALLFLLAVLMASGPERPEATDLLWYVALGWLAIGGVRYAIWFALALLPLLAQQLAPLFARSRARPAAPGFVVGYMLVGVALVVATLPWFQPARAMAPSARHLFATAGNYPFLLSSTTPVGATNWLAHHPLEGRFWADMSYTSYTIWRLPHKQVFADLRVELFPETIWKEYFAISRGDERSLEVIEQWQITHLMVDTHWQPSLVSLLSETPGWCVPYQDMRAIVFVRCDLLE
jgi:hypothetical protein